MAAVSTSCDVLTAKLNEVGVAKPFGPHSERVSYLQEYLGVRMQGTLAVLHCSVCLNW